MRLNKHNMSARQLPKWNLLAGNSPAKRDARWPWDRRTANWRAYVVTFINTQVTLLHTQSTKSQCLETTEFILHHKIMYFNAHLAMSINSLMTSQTADRRQVMREATAIWTTRIPKTRSGGTPHVHVVLPCTGRPLAMCLSWPSIYYNTECVILYNYIPN